MRLVSSILSEQLSVKVAEFMQEHKISVAKVNKMDDEKVIELLTQIKGVGEMDGRDAAYLWTRKRRCFCGRRFGCSEGDDQLI